MKTKVKRIGAILLAMILCMSIELPAFANEETKKENIWNGDSISKEITAGEKGYTFMSAYGPAYEMSNHMVSVNGGKNNDIPQTLIMVDASKDYTWTPDGVYSFGQSNYEVLYCCDAETGYAGGVHYKRMNLEDCDYYTGEEAAHIRAIVTNAYPFVSVEQMKANLKEDGFEGADELTRAEIITAVQSAIWAYANTDMGQYVYSQTFDVPTNTQWGTVMHDYTNEMDVWWKTGKRVFSKDETVEARINALIEHLKGQDMIYAEKNQIIITNLSVMEAEDMVNTDGTRPMKIRVALNNSGSSMEDEIKLNVFVDGELVNSVPVVFGTDVYELVVNAKVGQTVKAVVSGTQILPEGVYFYEPIGGRDVSQCLVGVAAGKTDVYAECENVLEPLKGEKDAVSNNDGSFNVEVNISGINSSKLHDEVIIMMDGSYSGDDEWEAAKATIKKIGKMVLDGEGNTQLTLMAFGMADNVVLEHVKNVEFLDEALGELPGTLLYGRSSTNCEAGMTGVAEYIAAHDNTLHDAYVIFISDGEINTDETPRAFDTNWKTFATTFGSLTVAKAAFENALRAGEKLPNAFEIIFTDRFDQYKTREEMLEAAFVAKVVTDEEFYAFADRIWADVYAYSGLTPGVEYPVSSVERAFVKYDKENGTYIQDAFYYTTYGSTYVTYPDRWTRTPQAATQLAAMDEVKHLFMIDTNGRSSWMDPANSEDTTKNVVGENVSFAANVSISAMEEALGNVLAELANTPHRDAVVTDYMSKWVNLIPESIKIVDKSVVDENGNYKVIWTYTEGWLIGEADRPTKQEVPVKVEGVPEAEYPAGGADVEGNISGDIIKLTWYVKDGILTRSDNYSLVYDVKLDEAEGILPGVNYPTNGRTFVKYVDFAGFSWESEIEVPEVKTKKYTVIVNYYDLDTVVINYFNQNGRKSRDYVPNGGKINYDTQDSWLKVSESYTFTDFEYSEYDVTIKDAIEIDGYTYVFTEGDALVGILDGDKEINVFYNRKAEESTEEETTTTEDTTEDTTEETTEEETEDFEDETDVPLGDKPVVDETPETGDARFAWLLAVLVSGMCMIAIVIKKKELNK